MIVMDLKSLKAVLGLGLLTIVGVLQAGALETYVNQPDASYGWEQVEQKQAEPFTITHLKLVSQTWREHEWTHHLKVVRSTEGRKSHIAFLFITGDGEGTQQIEMLKLLAARAGAVVAVVTNVPNQPLYDGRTEDALIAYTLDQYLKTGDETWPLLFPMVKSAVRAMDAVQDFSRKHYGQRIDGFVVSGASKRGWTTWLTAAVDSRLRGIAPMVIDMLNIKAQTEWAQKVYGRQSEKIDDYVELGLIRKDDTEELKKLRGWVDPYSYRERYTMPKLLLLGTNDPYWTVDALRHYWDDLPAPKLIFQTPNAGHDLAGGEEAVQSLAAFFQMIADGRELPSMHWQFKDTRNGKAELAVSVDQHVRSIRLWTADSIDRDFRNDKWSSEELDITPGSAQASAAIAMPQEGYRAYLVETRLTLPTGETYKLSTEARVIPDNIE
jgi:PhoPQ-activated pathogenicity-related protein